jgi:hypothetical protein
MNSIINQETRISDFIEIRLNQILNGNFRYYLDNTFRNQVFSELKDIYLDWRIVAKILGTNTRHLFGLRRGYEYWNRKITKKFISNKHLLSTQKVTGRKLEDFESNITEIKLGNSGKKEKIRFPISVNLEKESLTSIKRAIGEYILEKEFQKNIQISDLAHKFKKRNTYIEFDANITKNKLEELRIRGLRPRLEEEKEIYILQYRNPGTNNLVQKTVPKKIIFNEIFSKEFGKWCGDRCGGKNKLGVANKEYGFVREFGKFLVRELKQPQKDVVFELTCHENFQPSKNIISNIKNIRYTKHQYGNYAYRVEVANKILKNLTFDLIEANMFSILFNSKPSVRYAFYAGFFEAEGSIPKKSKNIIFSFGFSLLKEKSNKEILDLLKKVVTFKYLLNLDGFNSVISRKIADTKKSKTLKYDIRLLNSMKNRLKEVNFIKNSILPYITYRRKKQKILELEERVSEQNQKQKERELN